MIEQQNLKVDPSIYKIVVFHYQMKLGMCISYFINVYPNVNNILNLIFRLVDIELYQTISSNHKRTHCNRNDNNTIYYILENAEIPHDLHCLWIILYVSDKRALIL